MSRERVLVTNGETRAGVATVRGLAGAGFEVVAVAAAQPRPAAAHWSRSVAERITIPTALNEETFLTALERVVGRGDVSVLVPGSDASLLSVSRGRDRLEHHVRLGLPAHERVLRCLDRAELAVTAARHALAPPPTVVCRSSAQALEAARQIGFPVVAKPVSSSVADLTRRRRSRGSQWVDDAAVLAQVIFDFGGTGLVQQHVQGCVVSFAGVFADGRLLGEAVSRYRRTWYPSAGSACYSETIEAPTVLRRRVTGLLLDLGWQGLFELELIEGGDTSWRAIDFNPRPYGSMALAIGAGANLPAIWCRHLLGFDPAPVQATPGVSYRWTDADLRHGLWQLRNGSLPAAAGVLGIRRGVVHPYFRASDPGPSLARMLELGVLTVRAGQTRRRPAPNRAPALIIGAGPNGLAVTAHLRHVGIDALCFGEPLESWSHQMPAGMLLRSGRRASHIADPQQALTIDDYERAQGLAVRRPSLTLEQFVAYGRWFQRQAVPDLDPRKVSRVARHNGGFRVRLGDGDELQASRVIVAAGLSPFLNCPEPFASLPRSVRSHAYEHSDLGGFAGRRVAVIGSGQSALECAALLHERGAVVEVLARAASIYWLGDGSAAVGSLVASRRRTLSVSPPPTDVGGRVTGWIAATPDLFRQIPDALHPAISFRCIRPAGAGWLAPRLADVPLSCGCRVIQAREQAGAVELRLSDGSSRTVDHVLLGTGYRIDVRRYPFLAPELAAELRLDDGYPVLGPGLESSVAGLHFMGAPAAGSFGPIMRFVVGTWYAAPAVARRAAHQRQPLVSFSFPVSGR